MDTVEITGGRLQLPIGNGKTKEDNYHSLQTEGYDNARMKFVTTSINNHIGSDIQIQTGSYDSASHSFTYYWENELLKGYKVNNKRVLTITDSNNYIEAYYEERNGQYKKIRQLNYIRQK